MEFKEEGIEILLKHVGSLSEKARRHFLAIQYKRLGRGSQRYIAKIFGCSRITITKGLSELEETDSCNIDYSHQRKPGGGRKKKRKK